MIYASELRARRLPARTGKQLRAFARYAYPLELRTELSAIADSIREELAVPRKPDDESDESPQPRETTP